MWPLLYVGLNAVATGAAVLFLFGVETAVYAATDSAAATATATYMANDTDIVLTIASLFISPSATFCKYSQISNKCLACKFQVSGVVSTRY